MRKIFVWFVKAPYFMLVSISSVFFIFYWLSDNVNPYFFAVGVFATLFAVPCFFSLQEKFGGDTL